MDILCPKCKSDKIFKRFMVKQSVNSRKVISLNIQSNKRDIYKEFRCCNCDKEFDIK